MVNSRARHRQQLGTYEATSAEASKVFSFASPNFDKVQYLELEIDVGATLALELKLNVAGDTNSSYALDGYEITGGTETLIDTGAVDHWQITQGSPLNAVNHTAFILIKIGLSKAGSLDRPFVMIEGIGANANVNWNVKGMLLQAHSSMNQITIATSTSTWQVGTRFTLTAVYR